MAIATIDLGVAQILFVLIAVLAMATDLFSMLKKCDYSASPSPMSDNLSNARATRPHFSEF